MFLIVRIEIVITIEYSKLIFVIELNDKNVKFALCSAALRTYRSIF
jgi:hypothetical protein